MQRVYYQYSDTKVVYGNFLAGWGILFTLLSIYLFRSIAQRCDGYTTLFIIYTEQLQQQTLLLSFLLTGVGQQ